MIRLHSLRAATGLVLFGLLGCETVLGLSPTDPTLMVAGDRAGAAGQAGSAGSGGAGSSGTAGASGSGGVAGAGS
jgi:hypothetical protein